MVAAADPTRGAGPDNAFARTRKEMLALSRDRRSLRSTEDYVMGYDQVRDDE